MSYLFFLCMYLCPSLSLYLYAYMYIYMSALHIDGFGHRRATKIGTCDAGAQVQKKIHGEWLESQRFL